MASEREDRLLVLAEKKGVLRARIAAQREQFAQDCQPLEKLLGKVDGVNAGLEVVKQNPAYVGGAVAVLALLRPARAWRWAKRGFWAWRAVRGLKERLQQLA